jgi:peptide/nickel transport system substrate-binding protein
MKRLASLLAIAALVATACSSSSGTPAPAAGGTLIVGLNGDMVYADPSLVSDGNSLYVEANVIQGLVGLQPGTISTVVPVLASALPTVSSDGKIYTFKLRTGVKFHDGSDFNAAAVQFNYDRWKAYTKGDLQDNAYYYGAVFAGFGDASNISSVDAPDTTTVVVNLKAPQSNFLLASTLAVFGIQSPTALQKDKADTTPLKDNKYAQGQGESMVGTGPFMFKSWTPGDSIVVVKNPNYWDSANAAKLDQVTFKPFKDSTSTLQALQSGGIDLAFSISPLDVATAKSAGLTMIDRGASCNQLNLNMNQSVGGAATIYANKSVRMAVAEAVNKDAYVNAFYSGLGKAPTGFMPSATTGFKAETLPSYDVTKAKADVQTSSRWTSTTRPTSSGRTCRIPRALPRRSPTTSRPSASPSTSRPRTGRAATSVTPRAASSRSTSSAGPATGRVRTTSSTPPGSAIRTTSRTCSSAGRTTRPTR